jgi:hypothetical protein
MNLPTNANDRKERPVTRGVLDYFPDAIAEVARVSFVGNQQHNPGEPMHWAREKSSDHADCVARHLIERGAVDTDGLRHTAKAAWRALALLQEELEAVPQEAIDPSPPQEFNRRAGMLKRLLERGCDPVVAAAIVKGTSYSPQGTIRYVYIAGPMRGYPQYNFPAFDAARNYLVQNGWNVISPADIDRASGLNEQTPPESITDPKSFIYRDFHAMLFLTPNCGDAIIMLPGWERSTGAMAELFLARWLGLNVRDFATGGSLMSVFGFNKDDVVGTLSAYLAGQKESK